MRKSKVLPVTAEALANLPTGRLQMVDIARLAGVSTSTVSRALSGSPLVNAATTARILDIAKQVSYSVNEGAKNLRRGTNRTVAVVVPYDARTRQHMTDPFFLSILGCLADSLTERGYEMLVTRVDADSLDQVAEVYTAGKAMGIILIGKWNQHSQLNALAERGVPFSVWGEQSATQKYKTVGSDNVWGGYIATRHLLARGRKNLYFLGDGENGESSQRFEGFRKALSERNVPFDTHQYLHSSFVVELAEAAMHKALDVGKPIDGLFAVSDLLAMGAIKVLQARGLRVPQDVAIVGYDDIPLARYFTPALTTVAQPLEEGANALVELLMATIHGDSPESRFVNTELKIRASA